ncbi:aldo/keto reductase [Sphingobium nicotianae]|uniref:Aldo/keto reductase n=1 Tax=Sphingobium nicotianae TaxID=2782607 RepID=A0A9X1DD07_9SPHN|nr:aldo/keto reductase [Sphingobium nicotianae]MBT2187778.1 aldo/keto reductase [Sphingobium nicotianae]
MTRRKLGSSNLMIAPLMFGGNVFNWTVDEATSHTLLDAFVDGGFNAIDTADAYSIWVPGNKGGDSEEVIGSWLARRGGRERVVIATKTGVPLAPGDGGLAPDRIERAVDASLKRLKTDYIDLFQSHVDDANVPLAETLGAYDKLIKAGKIRAIGASNFTPERLAEALDIAERETLPRFASLQPLYNLYDRAPFESGLEQLCLDRDVGVISYYSLASGFLTGKYRSEADLEGRARGAGIRKYLTGRGTAILAALDDVAAAHGVGLAQIALAWLMQRPAVTAPIASATSLTQLQEIMGASRITLSQAQIAQLDAASVPKPAAAEG